MAFIPEAPGIKVTIEVNGLTAQEYDDQDGPQGEDRDIAYQRSDKYVESKDDAHFAIVYEVTQNGGWLDHESALSFCLSVDGDSKDSVVWEAFKTHRGSTWRHSVPGQRVASAHSGMESIRKFKFSKVTTVDDMSKERVSKDIKAAKSLGTIQVLVYSIRVLGTSGAGAGFAASRGANFEIAEKALKGKAVSHGTSFTDGGLVPEVRRVSVHYNHDKKPIMAFNFKYRDRDALHKELVIPRSPTPQGIDRLSEAEIRRLAAERLDDMNQARRSPTMKRENKGPVIKRENAEFYDLTEEPAKREWKKVKIDNNREAIDLTDD
ncbi:hypothetical protein CMUS01_00866 [Colletotrichum musicola]|uniref:DUF7918 domain-containing protein n=1 Tax=Colletotrichum musicola TaxID=2175873 RepID=A0A8H6NXX8_9PEZI|nr:hypothetical protein CMUS01_00866 [Colletotrichum musicola]